MTAFFAPTGLAQVEGNEAQTLAIMSETPAFIDDNFNPTLNGLASTNSRTLVQPDGKILVAGTMQLVSGASPMAR